jgi:hypothetical protein
MSELWGFQAGQQEAIQQNQKTQLFNLSMAEGEQSITEGAQNIEQQDLALKQAKQSIAQQDKALALLGQKQAARDAGGGQSADPIQKQADSLLDYADAERESGNVVAAGDAAEKATTLLTKNAEIKGKAADQSIQMFSWVQDHLPAVHDQQSLDAFKMAYQEGPGKIQPLHGAFAQMSYAQLQQNGLLDFYAKAVPAQLDKAKLAKEQADTYLSKANAKSAAFEPALKAAQARLERDQADALEKAGGAAGAKLAEGYMWERTPDGKIALDDQGYPKQRAITGSKADPNAQKPWTGREKVYTERTLSAANLAATAIENITKLPMEASTGLFGMGGTRPTGIFSATTEALRNKMSSQEVQDYNAMLAGVNRNLATVETMGMTPQGTFTSSMENLEMRPGDTYFTKLRKLAEMRQIVERGMDVPLADPAVPESIKNVARQSIDKVKKAVPFTQEDVTKLEASPKTSLEQLIKDTGVSKAVQKEGATGKSKSGKPIVFKNGQWVYQ